MALNDYYESKCECKYEEKKKKYSKWKIHSKKTKIFAGLDGSFFQNISTFIYFFHLDVMCASQTKPIEYLDNR